MSMTNHPRILSIGGALPPYVYEQQDMLDLASLGVLGLDWKNDPSKAEGRKLLERLFAATQVRQRRSGINVYDFFKDSPSTGVRMAKYCEVAYPLAREALEQALAKTEGRRAASDLTDFTVVSCTGYTAPGLDILLAKDLEMPHDVRRVCIGHMGCHGALAGLRQVHASLLAYPNATAALLSAEFTTLHFTPTMDQEVLTSFALFGDAVQAMILSNREDAEGPEVVNTYSVADFSGSEQMEWRITDTGFMMGLSPRVPVTLRRNVAAAMEALLSPEGLRVGDIKHWVVHPGGPSILEVVQKKLELSDEQMSYSWNVLHERANCSSATVMLILDELRRNADIQPGDWGVMMAFGPGLTMELALLRF